MPPVLAASREGSLATVEFTPRLRAEFPVKKLFNPRAASRPLLSEEKANCSLGELQLIDSWLLAVTEAVMPLTWLSSAASPLSVRSFPCPLRSTGMSVVCVSPVWVLLTRIWKSPFCGVHASPAWLSAAVGESTAFWLVNCW